MLKLKVCCLLFAHPDSKYFLCHCNQFIGNWLLVENPLAFEPRIWSEGKKKYFHYKILILFHHYRIPSLLFVCFIYPLLILWSSVHASTILWKWYFYWLKTAQNFTHNMFLLTRMQRLNVIPLIWKPLKCRTICTLSDYK